MKNNRKNLDNDTLLAKWIANEITDSEFKNLVSKEDYIAYQKIKKGVDAYSVIEKPLEQSFQDLKAKIELNYSNKVINLYKKWAFSIAASLLLLIGINYFFKVNTLKYQTNFAEQKMIALQDGSQITLNANTTLTYNKSFFSGDRTVFLQGEAFFKVKKGSNFIVKTKNGTVKVLGTVFNIVSITDYFKVHCYSGKVKVSQNHSSKVLLPKQEYLKINRNQIKIRNNNSLTPYWLNGETNFNSTPIKYVFIAFENQYLTKIDASKINSNLLFTGTFPNKNKKMALEIITKALNLKYKVKDNKIVLEKK